MGRTALDGSRPVAHSAQTTETQTRRKSRQEHRPAQQSLQLTSAINTRHIDMGEPAMASVCTGCDANNKAAAKAMMASPSSPRSSTRKHRYNTTVAYAPSSTFLYDKSHSLELRFEVLLMFKPEMKEKGIQAEKLVGKSKRQYSNGSVRL